MKKKLLLFLYLFFTLFHAQQKIHASFFEPSPITQDYGNFGDFAYATQWDPSGMYLAVGGIYYPTDLTIYEWNGLFLTPLQTLSFGNGAYAVSWSPNGQHLAVGGQRGYNSLMLYSWDGSSLTITTSKYHGTQVNALAWNPAGNVLAVGGDWENNDLVMYNWNGSDTLTLTTSQSHGTQVKALAWHPDGTKLAVAGTNDSSDLILYNWDSSTLTTLATKDHGTQANAVAWTHDGNYLAVGGANSPNDIIIYALNGSTLTQAVTQAFGTQANALDWSFDDQYLAVGGINGSTDLTIYSWYASPEYQSYSFDAVTNSNYGNGAYSLNWSPFSSYLAIAGDNGSSDITIYKSHDYLNGTETNITLTNNYIFYNYGKVQGSVKFTNGFTGAAKLALNMPISGPINNPELILESDLHFNAGVTLSNFCYIAGQNHTIYLDGDLTVGDDQTGPDNPFIQFDDNTTIDGNGHSLILKRSSQLILNPNITLTLKNLTLKNTHNTKTTPPIKFRNSLNTPGTLALDNVKLALTDDFYFRDGHLFIHNDVAFTGTSQFIFQSPYQSFITTNGTLYFAPGTTFDYSPQTNNKEIFALQNVSSSLFLDGCTLHISHTGMRMSKGNLFMDNNITITIASKETNTDVILTATIDSNNLQFFSTSWTTTGNYLAIGGFPQLDEYALKVYRFEDSSFKKMPATYTSVTPANGWIYSTAWRPGGNNYLAISVYNPTDGDEVQIFHFNRTSLTKVSGASFGYPTMIQSVAWSPNGTYLAIGVANSLADKVQIFSFNGTALTPITTDPFDLNSNVRAVAWSPNGSYLAACGDNGSGPEIKVYSFNGSALTNIPGASKDFGQTVETVAWSPNGNYLAVGGIYPTDGINTLQLFSFNGTDLTIIPGACKANGSYTQGVTFSPDGNYLATVGDSKLKAYAFNGTTLSLIENIDNSSRSITWKPNSNYITAEAGTYLTDFSTSYQSPNSSLFFGNSTLGPDYDLNINMLNGSHLDIHGRIKYDNFN